MLRPYTILRLTGYAAGLIGMILFILGRQDAEPRGAMTIAGAALLLVSFVAFIGSYVLYMLNQVMRRGR
jgi:hypothetical protein